MLEFSARGEFFPFYMELLEVCARSMAEKNRVISNMCQFLTMSDKLSSMLNIHKN